jgi:F-type H+-transporting ATPase subunit gamma
VKKVLLVAVTSNRGLCGGFNNNIIKEVQVAMGDTTKQYHVLPLGKKANDAFRRRTELRPEGFAEDTWNIFEDLNFAAAQAVGDVILEQFANGTYDEVRLFYNKFVNAAVQIPTNEAFLPLLPDTTEEAAGETEYIFEPSREEIVERIIPNSLKIQLYKGLLESHASEHGARMTAMHQATENASELLRDLRISYNKARQAAITTEILEIVAGSEALDG